MSPGDRVMKRGSYDRGTVERITPLGWIAVKWDHGPAPRIRPLRCAVGELVIIEKSKEKP